MPERENEIWFTLTDGSVYLQRPYEGHNHNLFLKYPYSDATQSMMLQQ